MTTGQRVAEITILNSHTEEVISSTSVSETCCSSMLVLYEREYSIGSPVNISLRWECIVDSRFLRSFFPLFHVFNVWWFLLWSSLSLRSFMSSSHIAFYVRTMLYLCLVTRALTWIWRDMFLFLSWSLQKDGMRYWYYEYLVQKSPTVTVKLCEFLRSGLNIAIINVVVLWTS